MEITFSLFFKISIGVLFLKDWNRFFDGGKNSTLKIATFEIFFNFKSFDPQSLVDFMR